MRDLAPWFALVGASCVWISTMGKAPENRVTLRSIGYSLAAVAGIMLFFSML